MTKIQEIIGTFGVVKQAGADGVKIGTDTLEMIIKMDEIIADFEAGMQSDAWVNNLTAFTSEGTMDWAVAVYTEIKTAREKLRLLDL